MSNKQIDMNALNKKYLANRIISSRYTFINFVPKNILIQLSKMSTAFFVLTFVLLCIPAISPFEPYSYGFALTIVIGTSMIKDAIEDFKRHQDDNEMNSKEITRIKMKDNELTEEIIRVEQCNMGDYLLIKDNEMIPADVILLKANNKGEDVQQAFVETSNLDGENNLKKKYVLPLGFTDNEDIIKNIRYFTLKDTGDSFTEYHCKLEYQNTGGDISEGEPSATITESALTPVYANVKNTLLRGSVLKNTESALCLVVAVGQKTKMSKSVKSVRKGRSKFEGMINGVIIRIFVIYFFMLLTTMAYSIFNRAVSAHLSAFDIFKSFFTNYILYTYLIPLSLFVTMEIARVFHGFFIEYDKDLHHEGETARTRNSSVIEDLGLVDYILTDKTGTLTNNSMDLQKYHLVKEGNDYDVDADELYEDSSIDLSSESLSDLELFVLGMLVCHQVDVLEGRYEAVSQEETSILKVMKKHGFVLEDRNQKEMTISVNGNQMTLEIISILEFSSSRQQQSIIVRFSDKNYMFTKGSEQKCLRNYMNVTEYKDFVNKATKELDTNLIGIKHNNDSSDDSNSDVSALYLNDPNTNSKHINFLNNATDYRALVFTYKELSDTLVKLIPSESTDLSLYYDVVGFGSRFLGSTFIEDSLQENVADTITRLKENGIKIWMITGDKKETAVACGRQSGIAVDGSYLAIVGRDLVQILREEIRLHNSLWGDMLVYSGALTRHYNLFDFKSLIVYRATPSQKGEIVSLLKKLNHSCLAIGDGNNDVAMLKEAHVGVGIVGKEGNQAALNSDFSIYRFHHLQKLLLCYGSNSLIRFSKLTLNAFYKNLYFILIQYFYNYYNLGTGFPIYNDIFLNYFNTFYTSVVPISIVLFDKLRDYSRTGNDKHYKMSRCFFTPKIININLILAIGQAIVCFVLFRIFFIKSLANTSGLLTGYGAESQLISMVVFFTVLLRQIRLISFFNIFSAFAILVSVSFAVVIQVLLQKMAFLENSFFGANTFYKLLTTPISYFIFINMISTMYLLDVLFEYTQSKMISTRYKEITQEKQGLEQ